MTKAKLIILAGIPGCGKSTYARAHYPAESIVSSDGIRAELYEGDYDPERNGEVFRRFHEALEARLTYNTYSLIAVADSTALSPDARLTLRQLAHRCEAETHVVFFTNTAQAEVNNHKRGERWVVPPAAMDHMLAKYDGAKVMIPTEDYDSITYIERVADTKPTYATIRAAVDTGKAI